MTLLVFKERLKLFYGRYEIYLLPLIKFIGVLITLILLNGKIGYMSLLKNFAVVLIISLLCSFLPVSLVVAILALFITAHIYALSMELAVVVMIILLIMFVAYYKFAPRDGLVLILMPVFYMLRIPYLIPIAVGLVATPVSIISVIFGTMLYYILQFVSTNAAVITNISADNALLKINTLLENLLNKKEMYLAMAVFSIVVIVVYVIRRLSIDYAWSIAIITGGLINLGLFLIGNIVLNTTEKGSVLVMVIGSIISIALAFILQFCVFSVDYSRTEHTQFEDDEYYYYVKAIPKINITVPEVSVKRINARRTRKTSHK